MSEGAWSGALLVLALTSIGGCGGTLSGEGLDASIAPGTDAYVPPGTDAYVPPGTDAQVMPGLDGGGGSTGWRPYSDDSPWNARIPAGVAIRPDSAALVEHLRASFDGPLSVSIHPWSVPAYEVTSATPLVEVRSMLSNEGEWLTFRWPVPAGAMSAPESDGHMVLYDRGSGREYDFYQGRRAADGTWDCTLCSTMDLRSTGVRPPAGGDPWYQSHGSRACGFPLLAGLIRVDEIRAGRIEHALVMAYPGLRQRWFVSPASTGHPNNGIISPDRGVPCGGRFQLDPSLDVTTLGLSPAGVTIARALQEYGMYVGDFSGSTNVYAEGSEEARAAWSGGVLDLLTTSRIPLSSLRVVEWGTLLSQP